MDSITTVLFDLDDTLWYAVPDLDFDRIEAVQHSRLTKRFDAWSLKQSGLAASIGRLWVELDLAERQPNPGLRELQHAAIFASILRDQGMPLSAEQVRALWDDLYVPHPHFERRLFVDTLQTLERLRQKGVRLGVVTNRPWTSSVFLPDLSAVGLADYFDVVVSSADVGLRKPHPFIFETALRALDGQPETALMVGDSLANDVGGAEACGMRGIWLRNSDEEGAAAPSHVSVQSISEIFDTGLF